MTSNAVDFVTVSGFRLLVSAVRIRRMWISLEIGGFRFLGRPSQNTAVPICYVHSLLWQVLLDCFFLISKIY